MGPMIQITALLVSISVGLFLLGLGLNPHQGGLAKIEQRYCAPIRMVFGFPWARAPVLLVCSLLLAGIGWVLSHSLTRSGPVSLLGILAGLLLPFLICEILIQKIMRDQEDALSLMFGMLKRWAVIHPDLVQCLSRVSEAPLTPLLRLALRRLITAIQHGVEMEKAFDDFSLALEMPLFQDFMIHLRFSARSRGDLVKLFDSFEQESFRLRLEREKTRGSQRKFKLTILTLDVAACMLFVWMIHKQTHVRAFYLESEAGLLLTAGLGGAILGTIYFSVFSGTHRGQGS